MYMFYIAETPREKKQVALYWEQQRKLAANIKDSYDNVQEDAYHSKFYQKILSYDNAYHSKFYKKILSYDTPVRPDFFSPLPKKLKSKIEIEV